jgi:hypothetical protein
MTALGNPLDFLNLAVVTIRVAMSLFLPNPPLFYATHVLAKSGEDELDWV